jgi:hypothetical protein
VVICDDAPFYTFHDAVLRVDGLVLGTSATTFFHYGLNKASFEQEKKRRDNPPLSKKQSDLPTLGDAVSCRKSLDVGESS